MTNSEKQYLIIILDDDIVGVAEGSIKVENRERSLFYLLKAREVADRIQPNEEEDDDANENSV